MSLRSIQFPITQIPDDVKARKLVGLAAQERGFMQRPRILQGILSADQWEVLADLVDRYTPSVPLDLTTRQGVELHDIPAEAVPAVQRALADAGITTVATSGASLRAITASYDNGLRENTFDVSAFVAAVREALWEHPAIASLPGKFKISFSNDESGTSQPYIGELGFIAIESEGRAGFRVVGGGSMGPHPSPAVPLFEWIAPSDAVPLAIAAVEMYDEQGDRQDRTRKRFRHLRERLGDEPFRAELERRFQATKKERPGPTLALEKVASPLPEIVSIHFPFGDVTAADARHIAKALRDGIAVRIRPDNAIAFFGTICADAFASRYPELARRAAAARIVICPGVSFCGNGIADTRKAAQALYEAFPDGFPRDVLVRIAGCPNGCSHVGVAPVGLVGGKTSKNGFSIDVFRVRVGGDDGAGPRMSQPIDRDPVSVEALPECVRELLQ